MAGLRSLKEALEHHSMKEEIAQLKSQLETGGSKVIEITKEIPVEVIKYVDKVVEVEKEVKVIEIKEVEKIKEIEKFIDRDIYSVPRWAYWVMSMEALAIIALLLIK
jgi:hypothetical protein